MKKNIEKKRSALIAFAFSLMATTAFAQSSSVGFIDELSSSDHSKMRKVAQSILGGQDLKGTALHGFFDVSSSKEAKQYTIKDLIEYNNNEFFNPSMPTMVKDGDRDEATKSFLNLLGFGGVYYKKEVDVKSALNQYLPTMSVRTVNGVKNIFFENPAFTNAQFAENINYYDSLFGLEHYVPTCVSNQSKHDDLLAYAFFGKENDNINVNGLSYRGDKGARLPIVELVGKYLAKQLMSNEQFDGVKKLLCLAVALQERLPKKLLIN